jgi:tagatose-6-phosphate ketose/aldose isomerase
MPRGEATWREIRQQPETWFDTLKRTRDAAFGELGPAVLTGAGTSAYAAMAIEAAWPGSRAVPSTELFLDFCEPLAGRGLVVSLARSGNSPESVAVVEKIRRARPEVRHIAVTANAEGRLANTAGVEALVLSERVNDKSLAMTSSFTNLVVAGLALARPEETAQAVPVLARAGEKLLCEHETTARRLAQPPPARLAALASAPLLGAAREACLKVLEMTAGKIATLAETYLGLRHGPMSFLEPETLVLCFVSSEVRRRRYELDLIEELRAKRLGRLVGLAPPEVDGALFDLVITTEASSLADYLRTPAEIIFAQMLACHASLAFGLDPDNPSPAGVIHRVVEGVRIYED